MRQRVGVRRRCRTAQQQQQQRTDVSLCVGCICQRSACLHPRLACQSVSQRTWKRKKNKKTEAWASLCGLQASVCQQLAPSLFIFMFVSLPNLTVGSVCRRRGASRGGLEGSPQRGERERDRRSLRVVVIASGLIRWPPGSAAALRQTRI